MLEKSELVSHVRCLGPLHDLRPGQLRKLIEVTGHQSTDCVEKSELVSVLSSAIRAGGRGAVARAEAAERAARHRAAAAAQELEASEAEAARRWRAEETRKARALLELAESEEQARAQESERVAEERRRLEERKTHLQLQAAQQHANVLEARLELERQARGQVSDALLGLEAQLHAAEEAARLAQASEASALSEAQLSKLRLADSLKEVGTSTYYYSLYHAGTRAHTCTHSHNSYDSCRITRSCPLA